MKLTAAMNSHAVQRIAFSWLSFEDEGWTPLDSAVLHCLNGERLDTAGHRFKTARVGWWVFSEQCDSHALLAGLETGKWMEKSGNGTKHVTRHLSFSLCGAASHRRHFTDQQHALTPVQN